MDARPTKIVIADSIRDLLKKKRWSQNRLADEAGVSRGYLSRLLKGDYDTPSMEKLRAIAMAGGTSVEVLTGGRSLEVPPYPYQSAQAQEFFMILERVPVRQWDEVFESAYYYALGRLQAEREANQEKQAKDKPPKLSS